MNDFGNLTLNDRKIIVGVDFGTTFSGVAWAETRKPDNITVIEQWPSKAGNREGVSSVKVPTELRYNGGTLEWGFQVPPIIERHKWFKLALADSTTQTIDDSAPRNAMQLTTNYLTALCEHLMYILEQKLGAGVLKNTPIEFVLTVPAIWTEIAKEKTLEACQRAGLRTNSPISLISEPEAAVIYALHQLDPHGLNIGNSFVLCDAGGGTVDLISYTITALHPVLQIKEAAAGTGGLCGSTFLNRKFGEYLKSKLGTVDGFDDEVLNEAMDRFDSVVKKQYSLSSSPEEGFSIPVPGLTNNPGLGIRRGRFTLRTTELKAIFEPVISQVLELVNGQIKASNVKIRAVLLVGGFGQNMYLKERLRDSIDKKGIEVLQPINAWTAVVRGAVMMGIAKSDAMLAAVSVKSRAARKHYGMDLRTDFDARYHDDTERYWCELNGRYRAHAMHWFIEKGDPVTENEPIVIDFVNHFLVADGFPQTHALHVYADATSSDAPVHKTDNVVRLVKLEADFSHLLQSDLEKSVCERGDGKEYYKLEGQVEAAFYSANTRYTLIYEGKRYDSVTAEYA